jgi:hypothetical protein
MIVQRIDLDVIPGKTIPVIHVNQGDTGQGKFILNLKKNGRPLSYPGTAIIQGTKRTGNFHHSASILESRCMVSLESDMTDISGDVYAQLVLTDGNERVGTQIFILRVQESA